MNSADLSCQKYWDASDWLIPEAILEQWCRGDRDCWKAKTLALLSACERGEINYQRSDGKSFDDPLWELFRRQILLVERSSFEAWVLKIEGRNPLGAVPRAGAVMMQPARPAWTDGGDDVRSATPTPVAAPAIPAGVPVTDACQPRFSAHRATRRSAPSARPVRSTRGEFFSSNLASTASTMGSSNPTSSTTISR